MSEFFSAFGASGWVAVGLAFLIGLAIGWLVRGSSAVGESDDGERHHPKEIAGLKAEIEAARSMIEATDGEAEADPAAEIRDQLKALDEMMNNAARRLKSASSAVKKSAAD